MHKDLVDALVAASNAPGAELAPAALVIARLEYPRLDAPAYLARLAALGEAAERAIDIQVEQTGDGTGHARIRSLNQFLFDHQQFTGNRERYEDPRNSCLNE